MASVTSKTLIVESGQVLLRGYQLCAERRLAHVRLGMRRGAIRIREEDLDDFLGRAAVPRHEPRTPRPQPMKLQNIKL